MILQLGLGKTVRLDLLPHSLLVLTGQPHFPEDLAEFHAKCGMWWIEEHASGSGIPNPVDPVRVSESDADAYGLESQIVYPVRPPAGRAPASQIRRYIYLCYGWDNDVYFPHSVVHTFSMVEHNPGSGNLFWELRFNDMSWVLHGFDPSVDPVAGLAVHDVMDG